MKTRILLAVILAAAASELAGQETIRTIQVPGETQEQTLAWLRERGRAQIAASKDWKTFHEFRFHDVLAKSGITFKHQVVDEAGKRFKPNHYDHGTALAAADVDSDGRIDLLFVNQRGGNELWRNEGGGRFANVTGQAGVALKDKICVAASFGDFNNDGRPDLFVTTVNMGNHLFINEGGGRQIRTYRGRRSACHRTALVGTFYR